MAFLSAMIHSTLIVLRTILGAILLIPLYSHPTNASQQPFFSETGPLAVNQRALELNSNLNVLAIALQPGYEDFGLLAYLRLGRGAKVTSAYLMNGESGYSDQSSLYPPQLAALRREEAVNALDLLDSEAYFLNFGDVASEDSMRIRLVWPSDSVRSELLKLMSEIKPDLVILCRDAEWGAASVRWNILRHDLEYAIQRISPKSITSKGRNHPLLPMWEVQQLWYDDGSGKGTKPPVHAQHPILKRSWLQIGTQVAESYQSLTRQRVMWESVGDRSYQLGYSAKAMRLRKPDFALRGVTPSHLGKVANRIDQLCAALLRQPNLKNRTAATNSHLRTVTVLMDSVDFQLTRMENVGSLPRKSLIQWKSGLENIRNALLNLSVKYDISETILTARQLTFVRIDSISSLSSEGTTEIFFPMVDDGWIINEASEKRLPLDLGEAYRLLSPAKLDFMLPHNEIGLSANRFGKTLRFLIFHRAMTKERSFVCRIAVRFLFAPRFMAQTLTPIVMAVPQEQVVIKLTNNSRDGVMDVVGVEDSLAVSTRSPFRLSHKGSVHLDTLRLQWRETLEEGTYLIPVRIGGQEVARFGARKISVRTESLDTIGVVTSDASSPLVHSLRRLGLSCRLLKTPMEVEEQIGSLGVVVFDARSLSLIDGFDYLRNRLVEFVERGGHLIILSQDARSWSRAPLWSSLSLESTTKYVEESPVVVTDTSHRLFTLPNTVNDEDWNDWLFRRAHNIVKVVSAPNIEIPLRSGLNGSPLVVVDRRGKGKLTYVDLAFPHQWMNIHAGSLRLLANLLSY